jgi:hypothetical protein
MTSIPTKNHVKALSPYVSMAWLFLRDMAALLPLVALTLISA